MRQGFSWSGHERNCLYLNTGDGFVRADAISGLDFDDDGRAAAAVDWDQDGDLDLLVTNRTGPRLRILQNNTEAAPSLAVRLEATQGNRDAIGARVELKLSDGSTRIATRRSGDGYLVGSSAWMHFGLGEATVDSLTVRWPNGARESFPSAEPGDRLLLREGEAEPIAETLVGVAEFIATELPAPPVIGSASRVILPDPLPLPRLEVLSSDGRPFTLFGVAEQLMETAPRPPLLLNVWASWCAPCVRELNALEAAKTELRDAGVEVLALSADEVEQRDAAASRLEQLNWTSPSGYATPRALEVLDALQGIVLGSEVRMPVPTSFLIDGRGNLLALYLGPVEPEQVIADLGLLDVDEEERRKAALPYPGLWHKAPPATGLTRIEFGFEERGLAATAREYQPGAIHLELGMRYLQSQRLADAERHFRLSLDAGPYFLEAYRGLAYTLAQAERPAEAATAYEAALQFAADDALLIYSLGLMRLRTGEHDAVRTLIERLQRLGSPGAAELQKQLDAAIDEG